MEVNKIKVKLGKEYYTGYYWTEPSKNGKQEVCISYEGIRRKQATKAEPVNIYRKMAEEMLFKLLNEL